MTPDAYHAYEHVHGIYFPIALGVFALVVLALLFLLVRGARRRTAPSPTSDAPAFELVYAFALAGVAAFLIVVTFRTETPLDRISAHPAVRIHITAAQWSWLFTYENGAQIAAVSTWRPPVAVVPTDEEIEFIGSSRDVIHGFWVPQLHFQRQLLPGYVTRFDLLFGKPGRYGGTCSVFCGDQHSEMHFALEAVSPERFKRWLGAQTGRSDQAGAAGAPE